MVDLNRDDYNNLLENFGKREYLLAEYKLMYDYLVRCNYSTYTAARLYRHDNPGLQRYPDYRVFRRLNIRMNSVGVLKPTEVGSEG